MEQNAQNGTLIVNIKMEGSENTPKFRIEEVVVKNGNQALYNLILKISKLVEMEVYHDAEIDKGNHTDMNNSIEEPIGQPDIHVPIEQPEPVVKLSESLPSVPMNFRPVVRIEPLLEPLKKMMKEKKRLTAEKSFQCDICKVKLKSLMRLRHHMSVLHKSSFRICEVCHRSQTCTKAEYISHLRRRHPSFRIRTRTLNQPTADYDGINYPCIYCEPQVIFAKFGELKKHIKTIHSLNYACSMCPKGFVSPTGLKFHFKTIHEKQKYSCPHCSQSYAQKAYISKHIRRFHQ